MFGDKVKSLKEICIENKILNTDKTLADKKATSKEGKLTELQQTVNGYYNGLNRKERRKYLKEYKKLKNK